MYLSHPVRRMRDDPGEETAALVVELADEAEPSGLRGVVDDAGGEVVEDLGFGCWLVRVPEAGVDGLCSLSGVIRIETDATLEYAVDETVEPDGDGGSAVDDAE